MLAELVHSQNKFCMLGFPYSNTSLGPLATKVPATEQTEKSGCGRGYLYNMTLVH